MRYTSGGRILVVDDEAPNVEVFSRLMSRLGYEVLTATSGELALQSVARDRPDLVLLDVNMPGIDGFEVCRRLKSDTRTRLIPVVLITGLNAIEDRVRGIEAGADDFLTKPPVVAELEARVRSLTRLKRYTDELESAESVILTLGLTIESRDPCTQGHCERLARYATALGARLGLDEDQLAALHRGAFLHDVGKVGIPDRHSAEARPPDAVRASGDAATPRHRPPALRRAAIARRRASHRPASPRASGWDRISRPAGGRQDPAC